MEGENGLVLESHSRLFSGLVVIGAVNIIGILNDPVPIQVFLATDCDCIAVGLLLSLHPCIIIV